MITLRVKESDIKVLDRKSLQLVNYKSKKDRMYIEYDCKKPYTKEVIKDGAKKGTIFEIYIADNETPLETFVIETKEIEGDFTATFRII